ncbi:MAG: U32 family peptidase [Acidaminococcaceae bacterium]|nr:U32 family peptidase [Acidaminococcaceae bacterium]
MDHNKKVELLAPAGSMEKCKMALLYGADAVYLGGKNFGLRAFAGNFSPEEMQEAVTYAHSLGKKVYVTVNIFPHNSDLKSLPDYLRSLAVIGVDALLISDLGVWQIARQVVPQVPLHVSTQANTCNWATAQAWQDLGAERVVLARELSLEEIKEINARCSVELEAFVHGAMCISYSGRCLLSSYFTGRDGNRGACAQVCRWEFNLQEKNRPGEQFPIAEDERGTYILNSRDLCLIDYLPQLITNGIDSLKIEGRMKSVHYVATVISVYRQAIDSFLADPEHYTVKPEWREELNKVSHRPYTTGFALDKPGAEGQVYTTSSYEQTHDFVGLVLSYDAKSGRAQIEQRNNVKAGEMLEVLTPAGKVYPLRLEQMQDDAGVAIAVAPHAQMHFSIAAALPLPQYSLLRRKI